MSSKKKLAIINGGFLPFIDETMDNLSVTLFYEKEKLNTLSWKLQFISLIYWAGYQRKFKDFSLLTPDLHLNFSASQERLKDKLEISGWRNFDTFLNSLPDEIKMIYRFMERGIHPWINLPPKGKVVEEYRYSLLAKPEIGKEKFDRIILLGSETVKKSFELYNFRFSFDFQLPDNLSNIGIFIEDKNNFGWFSVYRNEIEVISISDRIPSTIFFFIGEGTMVLMKKIEVEKQGIIKKRGRGFFEVVPPFLYTPGNGKFWKKLERVFCSPFKGKSGNAERDSIQNKIA